MQQLSPVVELVLMDETGSTAAVTVRLSPGSTYSAADSAASALGSAVLSITGCVIVRQRIRYQAVNDDPILAAVGSSILQCGVFIFECGDSNPLAIVQVPSIVDSALVTTGTGSGVLIDTTISDVADFISLIEGGLPTNPFGDDITVLSAAYRQSRT